MKKIYRSIVACISAVLILTNSVVPVYATDLVPSRTVTLPMLIDMALTNSGIVANSELLELTETEIFNGVNTLEERYNTWLTENGLENTKENYVDFIAYDTQTHGTPDYIERFTTLTLFGPYGYTILDKADDIVKSILGGDKVNQGVQYILPDEFVDICVNSFYDVVDNEGYGYYYVDVHHYDELISDYYVSQEDYIRAKEYIKSSNENTCVLIETVYGRNESGYTGYYNNKYYVLDNSNEYTFVKSRENIFTAYQIFNDNWETVDVDAYLIELTGIPNKIQSGMFGISDKDTFDELKNTTVSTYNGILEKDLVSVSAWENNHCIYFYGKQKGRKLIYDTVEAMRAFTGGNKPYYVTNNTNYDESVDNSSTFNGDYLIENGDKISYDIVKNQIDNSVDNTDNSVQNIVNDYSQTIINNYNGTTLTPGGDSDIIINDGEIINLLKSINNGVNTVLEYIKESLQSVADYFNTTLQIVKGFSGTVANFADLMKDLFSFIPEELMNLLKVAIGSVIAITVFNKFRK